MGHSEPELENLVSACYAATMFCYVTEMLTLNFGSRPNIFLKPLFKGKNFAVE